MLHGIEIDCHHVSLIESLVLTARNQFHDALIVGIYMSL